MTDLYKELIFSSNLRNFGTNENPTFLLESPLHIKKYKVKSVQIPLSNYLINSTNNKIYFTEKFLPVSATNGIATTTSTLTTITPGTYTIAQLTSHVQTQLNSVSALTQLTEGTGITTGAQYTVSSNSITNKLSILPAGLQNQIRLDYLNKNNTTEYMFGFTENNNSAYSAWDGTSGSALLSENVYDLSGTNLINIECPNISSKVDYIGSYNNVLASVPIHESLNNIIYWENNGGYLDVDQQFSELQFRLTNQWGNSVDLNSKQWNIILSILQ